MTAWFQTLAATTALVTLVVDGAVVPSAPPAHLERGRVVGPAAAAARFADTLAQPASRPDTLVVRRGAVTCSARARAIELAPLARCLGADVRWDGPSKTLFLAFPLARAVATHAPYDPAAPRVSPTVVFTPEPAPPTPRAIATGLPRPRRTAIPADPSMPITTPRPRSL